jgi:hypothetical protein
VLREFSEIWRALLGSLRFKDEAQALLDKVLEPVPAQRCLCLGSPVKLVWHFNRRLHCRPTIKPYNHIYARASTAAKNYES